MLKQIFIPVLALCLLSFGYNDKMQVSGKVMQTSSYCGGAEISPEEQAALSKPKPLAGKKFFVRKGNKNNLKEPVVATFVTDSSGAFMFYLPPGEYSIVDERKYDKKYVANIAKQYKKGSENYDAADLNCLKNWVNTPDMVFTVTGDGAKKIEVIYNRPCEWNTAPCINYRGPMPP